MKIRYWTHTDHIIEWDFPDGMLDCYALDRIGLDYAMKTGQLPDKVFLGLNQYGNFSGSVMAAPPRAEAPRAEKKYCFLHLNSTGWAQVIPVLKPNADFVMVGQQKDYDRYVAGDIFEKEVLQ